MPEIKRILIVGQCHADGPAMVEQFQRELPGVDVREVSSATDLQRQSPGPDTLVMINRVLEGGYDTDSGIDLISKLRQSPTPPATMLITNYPQWQQKAVEAGALPGFGKSALYDKATTQLVKSAIKANEPRP